MKLFIEKNNGVPTTFGGIVATKANNNNTIAATYLGCFNNSNYALLRSKFLSCIAWFEIRYNLQNHPLRLNRHDLEIVAKSNWLTNAQHPSIQTNKKWKITMKTHQDFIHRKLINWRVINMYVGVVFRGRAVELGSFWSLRTVVQHFTQGFDIFEFRS